MKVLKNNTDNAIDISENKVVSELKVECTECGSELVITKDDLEEYHYGGYVFECPCCGEHSFLDDDEVLSLGYKVNTIDDVKFPIHFHTTKGYDHVSHISNSEIEKTIKDLVRELRRTNDSENTLKYTSFGDIWIFVQRFDGDEDYYVMVAKDCYETNLKFTDEDYRLMEYR